MSDQPTLFGDNRTAEDLRAELKAAYAEQSRLNDLYHRYSKEAAELSDRARAAARREAWDAVHSTDMFKQPLIDEIRWLRAHITRTGRALHRQFGRSDGARCDCAGCELIVATDLREPGDVPDGELGPRTPLQQRLVEAETKTFHAESMLHMVKQSIRDKETTR
jgi:hypothetical protein